MITFLAWTASAAPVALVALWVAGEYILRMPSHTHTEPSAESSQPALPLSP
jgi:hypothetical protein